MTAAHDNGTCILTPTDLAKITHTITAKHSRTAISRDRVVYVRVNGDVRIASDHGATLGESTAAEVFAMKRTGKPRPSAKVKQTTPTAAPDTVMSRAFAHAKVATP